MLFSKNLTLSSKHLAMKTVVSVSIFCLLVMAGTVARGQRPNIIMFLIDDQNPSSIAAFGGDTYTPNLDRMAEEGMKFTRAYVSSSVCTPSRYTFLTGRFAGNSHSKRYAEAVGGKENQGLPNFNVALERDNMNVGNVLRKSGYITGFVGKFHLTSSLDFPEFYKGKNRWIDIPKDASPGPETSAQFQHNELWMRRYLKTLGFSWAKHVYPENVHQPYSIHNPEWTTVAALEFIEENKDGPFYLHLCSTLLHGPDKSWRKSMDHPLITGEGEVKSLPEVMTPRGELLKTITEKGFDPNSHVAGEAWIDDSLGAIFRKLKELGIDDNTLVIFAPDHGREGKASVFSHGSCQIPMIMRWPKGIAAGRVCEELVQNIDLAPTFFDLGKAEKPKSYRIDGQSLASLFQNGQAENWRNHLYLEMGAARATVTKDWSYIAVRHTKEQIDAIKKTTPKNLPKAMSYIGRLGIGVRGADRPGFFDEDQLYHLQRDPKEMKNLAYENAQATRLKEMRKLMRQDLEVIGRPFGEFLPGGNAAEPGQIDKQIAIVKQLDIKGKTVTVPEALTKSLGITDEPALNDKTQKKAERQQRKKAREEARANNRKTSGK
ncbi:sulfatase-like hydrolase/transferase [bacterium]|nr:sulfatase-like hydrolase/transferase [Rubripirellula sp.]MDB4353098.1 sulfatase-like hydrolase/transferase [bacterium]MDB4644637.1 sulfatase-like hydrolase/transferase [Rubripirellula sp.]